MKKPNRTVTKKVVTKKVTAKTRKKSHDQVKLKADEEAMRRFLFPHASD